ncbi:hypothetical protein BKA66DRAFT_22185, partial [Pyrenochaeta sp. MPI-SDFR-AT-0127]
DRNSNLFGARLSWNENDDSAPFVLGSCRLRSSVLKGAGSLRLIQLRTDPSHRHIWPKPDTPTNLSFWRSALIALQRPWLPHTWFDCYFPRPHLEARQAEMIRTFHAGHVPARIRHWLSALRGFITLLRGAAMVAFPSHSESHTRPMRRNAQQAVPAHQRQELSTTTAARNRGLTYSACVRKGHAAMRTATTLPTHLTHTALRRHSAALLTVAAKGKPKAGPRQTAPCALDGAQSPQAVMVARGRTRSRER